MKQSKKNIICFGLICLGLIGLDQLTKAAAVRALPKAPMVLIPGVFELRYLQNRGAAFGILRDQQWLFILFALSVTVISAHYYRKIEGQERLFSLRAALILLSGGALGNMIDRIFRHYVVDFLYFSLIDFPIFNVADIYVCTGSILLLISLLRTPEQQLRQLL